MQVLPVHSYSGGADRRSVTNRPSDRPTFLNPHVRSRMELRGITTEAIDWVLANYHTQFPAAPRQGVKPAIIYQGTYDGRELQVYVQRDSHPPYVKTAAWRD